MAKERKEARWADTPAYSVKAYAKSGGAFLDAANFGMQARKTECGKPKAMCRVIRSHNETQGNRDYNWRKNPWAAVFSLFRTAEQEAWYV